MSVYIVSYDLRKPGRDYSSLYDALRRYPHCHGLESVWFIESDSAAVDIRDHLWARMDDNDKLFVGHLSGNWGSYNVPCVEWLNSPARRW